MTNTATLIYTGKKYKTAILDVTALLIIYLTPAISHLFSFPVYLLEPMRIMLILAVVHTSRKNAYLLALTLPLFSFPNIIASINNKNNADNRRIIPEYLVVLLFKREGKEYFQCSFYKHNHQ
jgi:hypothetical protein